MAYKNSTSNPSATTATALYTVPTDTEAVVSTLSVCNVGADASFRVAVRPLGATLANSYYLIYEATLAAGETKFFTLGLALRATDILEVFASTSSVAFNVFYNETEV
jgi:hypothetical protein